MRIEDSYGRLRASRSTVKNVRLWLTSISSGRFQLVKITAWGAEALDKIKELR